ncbi:reverse transcriptase [Tanacetum coccineum]
MVEIKNLKQDGEVKLYQEQFEVLLNMLESIESYAVSLFIRGLKSKISMPVRMFKPTTLKDASCLARMQEATLALTKTKLVSHYTSQRSNSGTYANRYTSHVTPIIMTKPLLALPSTSTENTSKVVKSVFRKQLTQKELEEKRAKGLCFYCDQRYAPGHKFPGQLYSLEVCVDEIDEVEEVCDDMEIREDNQATRYTKSFPQISLPDLSGVNTYQAMRVRGYVGKQPLHILIDSGSTHNFLDVSTANKLPCESIPTTPLRVDVANGSKMREATDTSNNNLPLHHLLSTYADVFAMPTGLPPQRTKDHEITLILNTSPITVKPYRLPPYQKML